MTSEFPSQPNAPSDSPRPRFQFVTGRLAEFALRQVLEDLAPRVGFDYEIAVMPITVAALMPPRWVARHLETPEGIDKVILPGYCQGDLTPVIEKAGRAVERGPCDLRDLPSYFGKTDPRRDQYGAWSITLIAEINHAPRLTREELIQRALRYRNDGADIIDLGCDPGNTWSDVGDAVKMLKDLGLRVSIDSFDVGEIAAATRQGAELVLSVNATNRAHAPDWGAEVVLIPDQPGTLDGLEASMDELERHNVPYRIDPILEPIGFGFGASLLRYAEVRKRYPDRAMMMGIGNLTELTDADSAGINLLLLSLCEEWGVHSILTTEVITWAQSSVRELDLGRRLVRHAVTQRTLPKHLEPNLILLRDPKLFRHGGATLDELARRIKDPNFRIFAEDGLIHVMNNAMHLTGVDPFVLFDQMGVDDPSHAFYLGYELMKAKTALTLSKNYRQDQALSWGFLTEPEISHRNKNKSADPTPRTDTEQS